MKMTFFFTSTKVGFQLPNIGYVMVQTANSDKKLAMKTQKAERNATRSEATPELFTHVRLDSSL